MTFLQTEKKSIGVSSQKVFDFLADLNNFQKLLPEGRYSNWKSNGTECSFIIKKMTVIGMTIVEKVEPKGILMNSTSVSPIRFDLKCYIDAEGENNCSVQFEFSGDTTAFVDILIKRPLGNFFNSCLVELEKAVN